ncbi:MAG: hypothetical protein JW850_01650 [Thermoflexales bacterium]|nr:hypothetical protein [Thermoflexales bacterium]
MNTQQTQIDTLLDACLLDLRSGRASVEDCLARHPAQAEQLEALLRTATALYEQPAPTMPGDARSRVETRLLNHLRQLPAPRPAPVRGPVWRAPQLSLLRLASTLGLTILLLSLVTTGTIHASGSLPGQALYPLKAFGEQLESWLTPSDKQAELHLKFATSRLEEVMALGHLGVIDDLAIIQMESEMRQAMELLPTLSGEQRSEVTRATLELTQRQRVVLSSLIHYTPPLSQAGLEWGIDTATRREAMLETMLQ